MTRFILLLFLLLSCGPEPEKEIAAADPLHLLPFSCRYLGFKLKQLEGCSIACPKSVLEKNDVRRFTAELECTHPAYSLLRCKME